MPNQPFLIIPWQNDFITSLMERVLEDTDNNPGDTLIIFPHSRPRKYLHDSLRFNKELPKPFLMPQIFQVSDVFQMLRSELEATPPHVIEVLDRVGLLMECITDINKKETFTSGPLRAMPLSDPQRFFPWGMRLNKLLEDFFNQNKTPEDYYHMEGQVVPFAATLLGQLGRIHDAYTDKLEQRGWTTPGYDAFRVLQLLKDSAKPVHSLLHKKIYVAGFYGLTGVEKELFRILREEYNATIVLHSDAGLATGASTHWACREHRKWITDWSAEVVLDASPVEREQDTQLYEGFDLHSQLDSMEQQLLKQDSIGDTAVVLPDTGLMMPVLHHLPRKDVNISMGYPLWRSNLFQLLEVVLHLQENKRADGYYWKDIIDLIRHPYIKMLTIGEERPFGVTLHNMEKELRKGKSYTTPFTLPFTPNEQAAASVEEMQALMTRVLSCAITAWEEMSTPAQLADTLADLCTVLLEHGGNLWERFPIDAESMYRIMRRVIPSLRECSLAHEEFSQGVLFTILREIIRGERVPFEADPLTGLQVLGMLESRLLHFKNVYVLDATENKLPGLPGNDPLLPDSLRAMLGLPDAKHRESVAAYNFYRLISGATNINILYQTGSERSGIFEEKNIRSRFVEELIWKEECRQKKLLLPGDAPLHGISYPVGTIPQDDHVILRTPEINDKFEAFLSKPVSPSALNTYLRCPMQFYMERICGLQPVDEVTEDEDFAAIGDLFHKVLEEFFTQYLHKETDFSKLDPEPLQTLYVKMLHESGMRDDVPYDSFVMLEIAGKERLKRFLKHQPMAKIDSLEKRLTKEIRVDSKTRAISGVADRIDIRNNTRVILDYKTGSIQRPNDDLWSDPFLLAQIRTWDGEEKDPLDLLAETAHNLQLPAYLYMLHNDKLSSSCDAGWVELRKDGKEQLFFEKVPEEDHETIITEQIPLILQFMLRHMEKSSIIRPRKGLHCQWCTCTSACSV
ncbi:MAG: PD-(D/E)XK nuclease family protein [Desulfovibrionales bacterium]|nr:PD-(D/E)XK nuclease family protein [Desulfovibrionales bacterium]